MHFSHFITQLTVLDWKLLLLPNRITFKWKTSLSSQLLSFFPCSKPMATLGKKRKLTAVSKKKQEIIRDSQWQNTFAPGIAEEYITQVSEETESRVTKKLYQEFSRTQSRILGALSKLDEFFFNAQVKIFSGTTPGTSRHNDPENREPTVDCSQNVPYPKSD